jgi:bifunctional DNA-binding transcriptional regulator/antitoxin component of YhaV-PrlF toxin-antitoxin module
MICYLIKLHRRKMMGYISKVQVIQRGEKNRQYYFICPAPLAQALEIQKGEEIEWVVEDKQRLTIKRNSMKAGKAGRQSHAK